MTKYLLVFGCLGSVCGLVYLVDVQSSIDPHSEPPRLEQRSIYAPGVVEGVSPTVDLRPQTSGPIRVLAQEGAIVERGDVLLETQEPLRTHELAVAQSELRLAQAQLDRLLNGAHPQEREEAAALYQFAEAERDWAARLWKRTEELEKTRTVSQEEADQRQTQWKSLASKAAAARARADLLIAPPREEDVRIAEARVAAAQARLGLAQEHLNRTRLLASCSGMVLQVNVENGEEASPQGPEPAIVLADTSRLRVRAFVEEFDAPRVCLGMLATVTADGLPGRAFGGRVSQVSPNFTADSIPKVVGGMDPLSRDLAETLYAQAVVKTVPVSSCEVAEACKILENTYRSVNIAMVNELKVLFDRLGIDIWEVIDAAKTKPFGFQAFYPGPGLGGHCIPIDPFYLSWLARRHEMPTRFIELAGEVNTSMPHYVVDKTTEALNDHGKPVRGSRIGILGMAYKKDVDDPRESPSFKLLELLQAKGAILSYNDPHVPVLPSMRHYKVPQMASEPLTPAYLADQDCVLIATDHSAYDWDFIVRHARLVVDTRNATRNVLMGRTKIRKA